jgi:predicted small secreted protein
LASRTALLPRGTRENEPCGTGLAEDPVGQAGCSWIREWKMKMLIALLVTAYAVSLAGCNTVSGAGKDIERGGEKVQDAAESAKKKI